MYVVHINLCGSTAPVGYIDTVCTGQTYVSDTYKYLWVSVCRIESLSLKLSMSPNSMEVVNPFETRLSLWRRGYSC